VFARVSTQHKVRLVDSLQRCGHVVAMTGDGVNDAPAVKHAHMGIAMRVTGTDVTKEAANMVLTDDNFATIVRAVREGRTIYDNIGKFVRFQLSTNIGALLTVGIAPALGMPLPFTAIQILWVNIIMDGPPAMARGTLGVLYFALGTNETTHATTLAFTKFVVCAGRCPQPAGRRRPLATSTSRVCDHGVIRWQLVASCLDRREHSAD